MTSVIVPNLQHYIYRDQFRVNDVTCSVIKSNDFNNNISSISLPPSDWARRGRPKNETVCSLIAEGSKTDGKYKCDRCSLDLRTFLLRMINIIYLINDEIGRAHV